MKAVTGTVTSSKPISLSKASTALSRYAAGEISAYLKRVSSAFQDLAQVRREMRFIRKGAGVEIKREVEDEDESSRREEEQHDPNPRVSLQANAEVKVEVEDEDEAEERRKKKKKNKEKRREKKGSGGEWRGGRRRGEGIGV